MLLSPNDPSLASLGLNSTELEGAIALAQAIAEGPNGSNQPLEKRIIRTEIRLCNGAGHLSVLPIDLSAGVTVEYRMQDLLGRSHFQSSAFFGYDSGSVGWLRQAPQGVNQWQQLSPTAYQLDPFSGEIVVGFVPCLPTPLSQIPSAEVKVTYTGGLDFSVDNDDLLIRGLRAALVEIIKANRATAGGMTRFELADFYSVSMDNDAVAANYSSALSVFQALRTRV